MDLGGGLAGAIDPRRCMRPKMIFDLVVAIL